MLSLSISRDPMMTLGIMIFFGPTIGGRHGVVIPSDLDPAIQVYHVLPDCCYR